MEEKKWSVMEISGRVMVSDFTNIHCTDFFDKEYSRKEVKPGEFLNTPRDYDGILVQELDGEDVIVKIGRAIIRLTPGKWFDAPNHPLSYAWSELSVRLK